MRWPLWGSTNNDRTEGEGKDGGSQLENKIKAKSKELKDAITPSQSQSSGNASPSKTDNTSSFFGSNNRSPITIPTTTTATNQTQSQSLLQRFTAPETLIPAVILASTILALHRIYTRYLQRVPTADQIESSLWRRRSLLGWVTSVGDGDGLRLYHTPGGRLAGWGWFPGRQTPPRDRSQLKKEGTISIRLAGVDAPESAHFGQPGQPGGIEARRWLEGYVKGERVRARVWRRDQYGRAVATVVRVRWAGVRREDVGLEMLRAGMATVYEAKTGAEFGGARREARYRRAEGWARWWRRGIWKDKGGESPREFKERMKAGE